MSDHEDGRYLISYTPTEPGRWELALLSKRSGAPPSHSPLAGDGASSELPAMLSGKSFIVAVRPMLARNLSASDAAAAMEAHARAEVALACEGAGDGLTCAKAGEIRTFTVRMPARPLRSPPRRVLRSDQGQDVVAGGQGGRLGSWSAAEHRVLDQAQLCVAGSIEAAPGCGALAAEAFVLNEVRDHGDGSS